MQHAGRSFFRVDRRQRTINSEALEKRDRSWHDVERVASARPERLKPKGARCFRRRRFHRLPHFEREQRIDGGDIGKNRVVDTNLRGCRDFFRRFKIRFLADLLLCVRELIADAAE